MTCVGSNVQQSSGDLGEHRDHVGYLIHVFENFIISWFESILLTQKALN